MSIGDQKLHRELLIEIYETLDPDFRRSHVKVPSLLDDFEEIEDEQELWYHIGRLEENRLIEQTAGKMVQLTATGLEKLDQEGYETFLQSDVRYEILRLAYEQDRGSRHTYVDAHEIREELDVSDEVFQRNRWYLAEKGLIDLEGTRLNFQLTGQGRNRYEEYRDEGMPIPRTQPLQRFTQHTIEQGDREKVENVFREIVEIARDEVIVIDQFGTKDPLWDWLGHVPGSVEVKILASDKEIDDESIEDFQEFDGGRGGVTELRYLEYYDYPFHSREVISDREDGWIWDHTLPDSGGKHHTISQLRPVNLENDLEAFDEAWEEAEVVE